MILCRLKNGLIPPQYQAVFVRQMYNFIFKRLPKARYLFFQQMWGCCQKHIKFWGA